MLHGTAYSYVALFVSLQNHDFTYFKYRSEEPVRKKNVVVLRILTNSKQKLILEKEQKRYVSYPMNNAMSLRKRYMRGHVRS